jgi:hypothetical protein
MDDRSISRSCCRPRPQFSVVVLKCQRFKNIFAVIPILSWTQLSRWSTASRCGFFRCAAVANVMALR